MTKKLPELWLQHAKDDLRSAEILMKASIYNMVCFHSQQAVEKALKAIIAFYEQDIIRIHNLIRLYKICEDLYTAELFIAQPGFNTPPLAALLSFPRKRESRFRISPSGFPE